MMREFYYQGVIIRVTSKTGAIQDQKHVTHKYVK